MRPVDLFQFIFNTSMGVYSVDSHNRLCLQGEPKIIGEKTVIVADTDYAYALDEVGVNPFYETAREEASETILLFRTLQAGFNGRLRALIDFILDPKNEKLPKKLLSLRASLGIPVDDKLAKEWNLALDELKGDHVIGVVFSRAKLTTRLSCIPFTLTEGVEAEWPSSIRKKSPAAFLNLFKKLFGITDMESMNEKYGFKSRKKCASKLDALLQSYCELYEATNDYFVELDEVADVDDRKCAIDLASLRSHVENMEEYTRYMRGIAVPTSNQNRKVVTPVEQKPMGLQLPGTSNTPTDVQQPSGNRLHIPGSNNTMTLRGGGQHITPPFDGGYSGTLPNMISSPQANSSFNNLPPLHMGTSRANMFGDPGHVNTAVSMESSMARSPLMTTPLGKTQFN